MTGTSTDLELSPGLDNMFTMHPDGKNVVTKRVIHLEALKKATSTFEFQYKYGDTEDDAAWKSSRRRRPKEKHDPISYLETYTTHYDLVFAIRHFYHHKLVSARVLTDTKQKKRWNHIALDKMSNAEFGRLLGIMGITRKGKMAVEAGQFVLDLLRSHMHKSTLDQTGVETLRKRIEGSRGFSEENKFLMSEAVKHYFKWLNDTDCYFRIRKRCAWLFHAHNFVDQRLEEGTVVRIYKPIYDLITRISEIMKIKNDYKPSDNRSDDMFDLRQVPSATGRNVKNIKTYGTGERWIGQTDEELLRRVYEKEAIITNNETASVSLFFYLRKVGLVEQSDKGLTIVKLDEIPVDLSLADYVRDLDRYMLRLKRANGLRLSSSVKSKAKKNGKRKAQPSDSSSSESDFVEEPSEKRIRTAKETVPDNIPDDFFGSEIEVEI